MKLTNFKMDYENYKGLECTVPCDMYSVLLKYGYIPDPYYGTNEEILFDYSKKDCTFYTDFALSENELKKEKIDIVFYGLDTICDIYLNGVLLGSVMNMHRKYEFDIKGLAKENNTLRLEFKSPVNYFYEMENKHHLYMDLGSTVGACHLRKAFYMSGWDWAPKLPNMSIFRDIEVCAYDVDKIEDFEILQYHENGTVTLDVSVNTKHNVDNLDIVCEIDGQSVTLENGKGQVKIENPSLWYPNGFGEQYLYDISFKLYKNNDLIDTVSKKIGLRTVKLCRENDEYGQEFCFKVNGIKIFAMGANFVPIDSLPSRMTNERLEKIVQDCIFANFNCIRVWGGAFYPNDYLYDLCDKYGLLLWQDFMVACANVWLRDEFVKEFKAEAIYNIKRIRHHACLGILCGNNEMELAVLDWPCADGNDPLVRKDYLELYESILPKICAEYAPQHSYVPSSPTSGGNFDDPNGHNRGDVHFWDVWHGNCGFDEYRKHKFRFCSEYGYESLPDIKTINAFCPENERNLVSYTMECHQKCWGGNIKIMKYLADQYLIPKDLETIVYASQLNQANAIKYGVEHFRRHRGYTMGSVYWQLNDCWPVASWSSIDYYGRYKALHYFARKFYQSVSLGLFNENGKITVNIANETLKDFKGYIKVGIIKNDFSVIFEDKREVFVSSLTSSDVIEYGNDLFDRSRDTFFYCELYDENGTILARNTEIGVPPKHFIFIDPQIKVDIRKDGEFTYFKFNANAFAKNVQVSFKNYDIALSDNYFDLTCESGYEVYAKTDLDIDTLIKDIKIMSVYDIPAKK